MAIIKTILSKNVGLFVENNIDNYRREEDITFRKMLDVFLKNDNFFVLRGSENEFIGYLEPSNISKLTELIKTEKSFANLNLTIKQLRDENELPFKTDVVFENFSLKDVVNKLNSTKQTFLPVLNRDGNLIGRVSKKILKERIKEIYGNIISF